MSLFSIIRPLQGRQGRDRCPHGPVCEQKCLSPQSKTVKTLSSLGHSRLPSGPPCPHWWGTRGPRGPWWRPSFCLPHRRPPQLL